VIELDSPTKIQIFEAALSQYANRLPARLEDSILGAFVVFLSVNTTSLDFSIAASDLENLIRICIEDFWDFFQRHYKADIEQFVRDVNIHDPALHDFIRRCKNLELSLLELKELLDRIICNSLRNSDLSISRTPGDIIELMIELVGINEGDEILDPASGSGSFLQISKSLTDKNFSFTGIEIKSRTHVIACLYSFLSSDMMADLRLGNSFEYASQLEKKFDIVMCNPPVEKVRDQSKLEYMKSFNFHRFSSELALNFIELSLNSLKDDGRAVFLINLGPLFSQGEVVDIRRYWVESGYLKKVVNLPSKLLPFTSLKCAILVFDKGSFSDGIKFIKAEDCCQDLARGSRRIGPEGIKDILQRATMVDDGIVAANISFAQVVANNFILVPDQYLSQQIGGIDLNLAKLWKPLEEMAEIIRGSNFSSLKEGEEPIIQGRDLRVEQIQVDRLEKKDLSSFKGIVNRTQVYDILLQKIGRNPAAYLIRPGEEGYGVSETVFIIRFKEIDPDLIDFITQFMNSDEGSRILSNADYTTVPTQSLRKMRAIQVPVPDLGIVKIVQEMNLIEEQLRGEYEKAAQLRKSIFSGINEVELSTDFDHVRFASKALQTALKQKDDIQYKIRSLYPFPIAFSYRKIYLEQEYTAIYERQMKYGEYLLSFLCSIGLSLLFELRGQLSAPVNELMDLLRESLRSGISPGDWHSLLQKICLMLKTVECSPLAAEFASIWFRGRGRKESDFAIAAKKDIVERLNDFKHGRGPSNTHEYKTAGEEQRTRLNELLESLAFLSQCDLILINDIDVAWKSGETTYTCIVSLLKGDHPAFEKILFLTDKRVSKNKLYLRYGDELICLHPLLSYLYNCQTKKPEIFSFDKEKKLILQLKSFDSGTSLDSDEITSDWNHFLAILSDTP
jgi:type I restriction-modification system DNA methylase subunit